MLGCLYLRWGFMHIYEQPSLIYLHVIFEYTNVYEVKPHICHILMRDYV